MHINQTQVFLLSSDRAYLDKEKNNFCIYILYIFTVYCSKKSSLRGEIYFLSKCKLLPFRNQFNFLIANAVLKRSVGVITLELQRNILNEL